MPEAIHLSIRRHRYNYKKKKNAQQIPKNKYTKQPIALRTARVSHTRKTPTQPKLNLPIRTATIITNKSFHCHTTKALRPGPTTNITHPHAEAKTPIDAHLTLRPPPAAWRGRGHAPKRRHSACAIFSPKRHHPSILTLPIDTRPGEKQPNPIHTPPFTGDGTLL